MGQDTGGDKRRELYVRWNDAERTSEGENSDGETRNLDLFPLSLGYGIRRCGKPNRTMCVPRVMGLMYVYGRLSYISGHVRDLLEGKQLSEG